MNEEILNEDKQIHCGADPCDPAAGRRRDAGCRAVPLKAIEDENRRLKRMYADLSMQADLLKEALGKK